MIDATRVPRAPQDWRGRSRCNSGACGVLFDDDEDTHQQGDEDTKLSSEAQGHNLSTAASNEQALSRTDGAQTHCRLDREDETRCRGKDFKARNNGNTRRARSSLTKVDAALGESLEA
ncbi:MAG: hypothetical protein FWD73_02905 [Polyangiaceae bacterium]|nr:hypothetical protein [Polyangiaceae bacterium]